MVDQVAVQSAIPVFKRVYVDKTECEDCSGHNRVGVPRRTVIKRDHPVSQGRKIFMAGTYVIRQWHPCFAVMLSNETTLIAETQLDEPRITNDDPLQS